jgi:hypothetical protein
MEKSERPMKVPVPLTRNMRDETSVLLLQTKLTEQRRVT